MSRSESLLRECVNEVLRLIGTPPYDNEIVRAVANRCHTARMAVDAEDEAEMQKLMER